MVGLVSRIYNRLKREGRSARMHWHLKRNRVVLGRRPQFQDLLPLVHHGGGQIVIGDYFEARGTQFQPEIGVGPEGKLLIGDHVHVGKGVSIHASKEVIIGEHCRLGDLSCVWDSNFHEVVPGEGVKSAAVHIGRNVWLGRMVSILPGVKIGDHSVVATGAVVTKSLPPRSIAAGVPATVVRKFDCPDDYVRS